jgi:hypothetical protein
MATPMAESAASIPTWLLQLPTPVLVATIAGFSAAVASIVTLIGIGITNRGHNKRLREQLAQDRDLRRLEREQALRREICVNAAEAMESQLEVFEQFANPEMESAFLRTKLAEKGAPIVKVYLIATPDTVRAVSRFSEMLTLEAGRLIFTREAAIASHREIDAKTKMLNERLSKNPPENLSEAEMATFRELGSRYAKTTLELIEDVYSRGKT